MFPVISNNVLPVDVTRLVTSFLPDKQIVKLALHDPRHTEENLRHALGDKRATTALQLALLDTINSSTAKQAEDLITRLGADPNAECADKSTAMHIAAFKGTADVVEVLLRKGNPHVRTVDGCTPLYFAVMENTPDIVAMLLDAGADIDAAENYGITPLICAFTRNNPKMAEVVKTLLSRCADVERMANNGFAALHQACCQSRPEAVVELLEHDVGVDSRSGTGFTGLAVAAFRGNTRVAELLLARGAKVDARVEYGNTPLYLASAKGHIEVMKLLIGYRADPDKENTSGDTARGQVARTGNPELINCFANENKRRRDEDGKEDDATPAKRARTNAPQG